MFRSDGQEYIAYHAWEGKPDGKRADRRFLDIDKLARVDGRPVVQGTILAR